MAMRSRLVASAVGAALITAVSLGTATVASAAPNPANQPGAASGKSVRNAGDWSANGGCVPTNWAAFGDPGFSFNAWAFDTYSAVVHNDGTYTENGTFTAYCDPLTGSNSGTPGQVFATPVEGTLHGTIQYSSSGAMIGGTLTYAVNSQGWVFTETYTASGGYSQSENQPLQSGR